MKLKLFLIFIIIFVTVSILLLTGTMVSFLLVIKSFVMFLLNFIFGVLLIFLGGNSLLFAWNFIAKKLRKSPRTRKVYVKKVYYRKAA